MRHGKTRRQLSRTAEHRKALLRNLVTELFRYERIETTHMKAKEARRLAERLITFAKRGDLAARRQVDRYVMCPAVTRKLFSTIAPWYAERPGGYTRIIRLGTSRLGDRAPQALLMLVDTPAEGDEETEAAAAKAKGKGKGKDKGKAKKGRKEKAAAK